MKAFKKSGGKFITCKETKLWRNSITNVLLRACLCVSVGATHALNINVIYYLHTCHNGKKCVSHKLQSGNICHPSAMFIINNKTVRIQSCVSYIPCKYKLCVRSLRFFILYFCSYFDWIKNKLRKIIIHSIVMSFQFTRL